MPAIPSNPADTPAAQTVSRVIPFDPPGTFAPGSLGSAPPGVVPTLAPSYPIRPPSTFIPTENINKETVLPLNYVATPSTPQFQPYLTQPPLTQPPISLQQRPTSDPYAYKVSMGDNRQSMTLPMELNYHQHNPHSPPIQNEFGVVLPIGVQPLPLVPEKQADSSTMSTYPPISYNTTPSPSLYAPSQMPASSVTTPGPSTPESSTMNTLTNSQPPVSLEEPPAYSKGMAPTDYQPLITYGVNGLIKSRDPMLTSNGDALYQFILNNLGAPTFCLHCYGSHTVSELRANKEGKLTNVERTVVDFDFTINLGLSMNTENAQLYVLDDNYAAYRGKMQQEIGNKGKNTVEDWVRDFTSSPKTMKKFKFQKVVNGVERAKIVDAVSQIINSTGHSTYQNVYFTTTNSGLRFRTDSSLYTFTHDSNLKCLLRCLLVWPILYLCYYLSGNAGKWDVCRAGYTCTRDPRDPDGTTGGVPLGDGDWVKIWERTIRLAVGNRIQSSRPIYRPTANDSGVIVFD